MAARIIDPAEVAEKYREEIRADIARLSRPPLLVGILSTDHGPSRTYAEWTGRACEEVGVGFELRQIPRMQVEQAIREANADPRVDGIIVYYPVFGTQQDHYLRDLVDPMKDIEGLHSHWARALYENRRFVDEARTRKAIVPCTPLAILKLLDAAGACGPGPRPLAGKTACVFNRSEVVGRPLASMMANDGARVISFDVDGPQLFVPGPEGEGHGVEEIDIDRAGALAQADIVVTGVPSRDFPPVRAEEIKPGAICVNFSTVRNFADDIVEKAGVFIPRVGTMTVTMALRNIVRLRRHAEEAGAASRGAEGGRSPGGCPTGRGR